MNEIFIVLVVLCVLISNMVIFVNHHRTKKTMDTIEQMLNAAIDGTYSEKSFDESRLSALESKFSQFMSSSTISSQNLSDEKAKIETLISDISHQTKTPISNLILYSELIAEEEMSEDMQSNVNTIRRQAQKLRFLIDSLIKLSRLENGILNLSPKREYVQTILDEILEQYAIKARDKGLELYVSSTTAVAVFDPKWTIEAMGNFVDNAIKYTSCGSITVEVSEYELFTRIDVIDTGIGIEEYEQSKIFARFYRSETVRDNQGVGIGLYLAREIISAEGGYIKLTSKRDIGSTFSIFLPR